MSKKRMHGMNESESEYGLPPVDATILSENSGMETDVEWVDIRVPLSRLTMEGYTPRKINARITRAQGRIVDRMLGALDAMNARTLDGQHVARRIDVVRWLLDQVIDGGKLA